MKLAIGILVVGIAALSSAAPYEAMATKQGKLAKLESLLGRALLRRAVREQSDDSDNDDGLADFLAIMEGDDDDNSEDDDGAEAEKFKFHVPSLQSVTKGAKKFAGGVWKNYGGTIKQVGKNYLKSKGLGALVEPTKLQDDDDDDSQATIEELLDLLQDDDDSDDSNGLADIEADTGDGTDTSDSSNNDDVIEELLAQLQNRDLADIEDTSDTDDYDDGNLVELQLAGMICRRLSNGVRNIANRLRRRFRRPPPPPGPPLPPSPPPPPGVPEGHPALRRFFH